ncbi:unnamed protein product [Diatraea saccharalis]|nr:unnamed protein product [Diatraea saccharalis]
MKHITVFIILFFSPSLNKALSLEKSDIHSISKGNTTEQNTRTWNIKLDIYFSKSLPPIIKKTLGTDVRLKCEATMNFTKVEKYTKNKGVETLSKESPPDHIQQRLMKNVKVYWLKNSQIVSDNNKIKTSTKIDMTNGTIGSNLKIKDLDSSDNGNYTCVIKQNYEKYQTTLLKVFNDDDTTDIKPTEKTFVNNKELEITIKTTPELISEDMKSQGEYITSQNSTSVQKLEPICQEYNGKVCAAHLKAQFVYIPYDTSQTAIENKLMTAIRVTQYSNDISSQCEGYALPSLCYSTFPICRDPIKTNKIFFEEAKRLLRVFNLTTQASDADHVTSEMIYDNVLPGFIPNLFSKFKNNETLEILNYRYNSTILRRVCKQDCEILENELCQTEYAIAKRHPHIGRQLTLEECQDLPEDDPSCLKIGIGPVMVSDDECYWENGSGYLGRVNVANNGMACIEWSKQMHVKISDYPELTGRHSYCRNPGGIKSQPWCIVEKDGKTEKQLCDIHKCAHKIWIYIVIIFLLLTISIVGFVICLCYRHKTKGSAATIRDINLPNADKNIYGNSRLNSPIEMNDLLTNQNINNQPHLTRNTRGNGLLRIPQYSLSQIKFLEELGEGAFGKVYKGALKKNGETQYVAVKALKENASAKTQADFRREIDLISELTHENIVCIVGVALREEPLCMLFEFMARGDLHEFLMGRAPPSGKGLPPMRLLNIANNIASGMQYLASHHYVHRDLAARNCLVSDDFVVKISDFGLSRDIYSSDYYRVQSKSLLPVRWMPPESILYGKFTTESDIWSYGVVLWEIYSYGLQPYYG